MDHPELDRRKLFAFRTYRRRPTKVTLTGRLGIEVRGILNRFRGHGSEEDPYAYMGAPITSVPPKLRSAIRLPLRQTFTRFLPKFETDVTGTLSVLVNGSPLAVI